MKNWSGSLEFNPEKIFKPNSKEQIIEAIAQTIKNNKTLRPIGSTHSWTPLFNTDEFLMDLSDYQGSTNIDAQLLRASFKSGTKVFNATNILLENKLSFENQGDIDSQSLSGALNTGTHGTGLKLKSMPNQMHSFELITASGELKKISKDKDPELFNASAIGLGLLGIVSEIEIQAQPLYQLKIESEAQNLEDILPNLDHLISSNRHFELFYFPMGDWALIKKSNLTNELPVEKNLLVKTSRYINDVILENHLFEFFNNFARLTNNYQLADKIISKFVSPTTKIDFAQLAFPTKRSVRFMEMEYCVDLNDFNKVLVELKKLFKDSGMKTLFPIEIRFSAADDLWLSPAYKRPSVYFAVHTYIKENYQKYFLAAQEIFKQYQGRPHWGKWHTLNSSDLQKIYPKFKEFKNLQRELDPMKIFVHKSINNLLAFEV